METNTKKEDPENTVRINRRFFKKNKQSNKLVSLESKNCSEGTTNMNCNLFQTIEESEDATQYVKMVEELERYAFKAYKVNHCSLLQQDKPNNLQSNYQRS